MGSLSTRVVQSRKLHSLRISYTTYRFQIAKELYGTEKSRSSIWQHWRSRRRQWSPWISCSRPFANHGGGSASSIFLSRDASPSVFLYTAGKCNPNPKNRQWCDLGKNHFDSVFLWIEWFHPWGRFGFMRMTGMILWRFIQNLFEMEYTYKKAMDSILGQREMVLFERIIICGWYNTSTRSYKIRSWVFTCGGNVLSYTLGIWLLTTLV